MPIGQSSSSTVLTQTPRSSGVSAKTAALRSRLTESSAALRQGVTGPVLSRRLRLPLFGLCALASLFRRVRVSLPETVRVPAGAAASSVPPPSGTSGAIFSQVWAAEKIRTVARKSGEYFITFIGQRDLSANILSFSADCSAFPTSFAAVTGLPVRAGNDEAGASEATK